MTQKQSSRICREGYYYLIVLGFVVTGAVLREINLLLALAGMMSGPLLLNWRMTVDALRGVHVRRRLPERVEAGDRVVIDHLLEKRPLRSAVLRLSSWALALEDTICHEDASGRADRCRGRAVAWRLPYGGTTRISYRGRFFRRGRHRFGPVTIRTRFPLGLVRRVLRDDRVDELIVLPRRGQLGPAWNRLYRESFRGSLARPQPQLAREGEFHGLRDWKQGDVRRWIHWRTTARRGVPVVRQFERRQHRDLALLVDLASSGNFAREEDPLVESAVSLAATMTAEICRRAEGAFLLGLGGRRPAALLGNASTATTSRLLEALAVARADRGESLPALLRFALQETRPGTPVVLVTTRSLPGIDLAGLQPDEPVAQTEVAADAGPASTDIDQLDEVRTDPRWPELRQRLHVIDVGSNTMADFFQPAEQPPVTDDAKFATGAAAADKLPAKTATRVAESVFEPPG
ncbi:MAG: DUF58 domain-containing protein [Planctomycetota bacterium]|nr:MAG: DUF58 domain-containing protein [Planctomycetota bacterium]REJ96694.1 MAG: DUF58 domain-containing protein [Planctomycetota bacterium]